VLNTPAQVDLTLYKDVDNNKFANHNGYFNAYYPNPYWQLKYSRYKTRSENLLGSAVVALTPARWIEISYRTGITYSVNNRDYFRDGIVYSDYLVADPGKLAIMQQVHPSPELPGKICPEILSLPETSCLTWSKRSVI